MRRALAVVVVLLVGGATPAGAAPRAVGDTAIVTAFSGDAFELPEGIAIDKRGRIYVSMAFLGEIRRLSPDGSSEVFATIPPGEGGFGPVGLAVDAVGNVYAAAPTFDPATHGVYRITPDGAVSRLPGSEEMAFPNGVALDDRGTVYATDSMAGAVWAFPRRGAAEEWLVHAVLAGDGSAGVGFPVGANGVVFRNRTLYVANSELGRIVAIPVLPDGSAGAPAVVAEDAALFGADGLAIDVQGRLAVAVIAQNAIVLVTPGSTPTLLADADDGLDFPSSVAYGTGRGDRTTLYAVNFSIGPVFFGVPRTTGPAVVAVEAGVPGMP